MNLDEQFTGFGVKLFALATIHLTSIFSQAFAECYDNWVAVINRGFL